ncbi:MAG TPA: hypothetical protein VNZ48_21370 [Xanthobacteraceae bacterium]|jgi:hypothetical protein|nr:hypothetical protein [Xanthobacteraceae bacterium]
MQAKWPRNMARREFLARGATGLFASAAFGALAGCGGAWLGRTVTDSHASVASPAMTTWTDNSNNTTLVMVWCGGDGTVYFASGMEKNGTIQAAPLPGVTSLERPALIQFQDRLVLGYIGTDNNMWCALSYDGKTFPSPKQWLLIDGTPLSPSIGGPALVSAQSNVITALTAQADQTLHSGFSVNPPTLYEDGAIVGPRGLLRKSIDTPALAIAPGGGVQLAYAGADDPLNHLTLQADPRSDNPAPPVVFDDLCSGGPALVTTGVGYAAAYVGKNNNIYLLYGVDKLDPGNVRRWKFQDTSWHPPAVAIANGVTYVAWIGTDGPTSPYPTGSLNFASLISMPPIYTDGSG